MTHPEDLARAEIETRLQEVLDETMVLERQFQGAPERAQEHPARLAFLAEQRRILEGLLATVDQREAIARAWEGR